MLTTDILRPGLPFQQSLSVVLVNMKSFLEIKVKWRNLMSVCALAPFSLGGHPQSTSLHLLPHTMSYAQCWAAAPSLVCLLVGRNWNRFQGEVCGDIQYPDVAVGLDRSRAGMQEYLVTLWTAAAAGGNRTDMECLERKLGRRKLYFNGQDLDWHKRLIMLIISQWRRLWTAGVDST